MGGQTGKAVCLRSRSFESSSLSLTTKSMRILFLILIFTLFTNAQEKDFREVFESRYFIFSYRLVENIEDKKVEVGIKDKDTKRFYVYETTIFCKQKTILLISLKEKGKLIGMYDRSPDVIEFRSPAYYIAQKVCGINFYLEN